MGEIIYDDNKCNRLNDINNQVKKYPSLLDNCNNTFGYINHTEVMQSWANGTEAGKSITDNVEMDIKNIQILIDRVREMTQQVDAFVSQQRLNNRKRAS